MYLRSIFFLSVKMPEVISIAWLQFRLHTALDVFLNFLLVPLREPLDIEIHVFFLRNFASEKGLEFSERNP